MILTYKYRLKDRRARHALRAHAYAANQVWNYCVAQQRDTEARWRAGAKRRKWATGYDLTVLCKGVGPQIGINQKSVGTICCQFARARDARKRAPRFRTSFGARRSLGWIPFDEQARQVSGNTVTYCGRTYRFWEGRRPLPPTARGGCFVEDASGRWYVCFWVDVEVARRSGAKSVGIDLGVKTFATLSDGTKEAGPKAFGRHQEKLAVAQRAKNRRRARAIYAKIRNTRADFLHKLSAQLVSQHGLIAIGNVNPRSISQICLAKNVYDAGWSAFRFRLRYKCQQAGVAYVEVDERFTTRTCSSCGASPPEWPKGISSLGVRDWECAACGECHDRDVNSARNILNAALSAQRLAGESRPPSMRTARGKPRGKADKHDGVVLESRRHSR